MAWNADTAACLQDRARIDPGAAYSSCTDCAGMKRLDFIEIGERLATRQHGVFVQ